MYQTPHEVLGISSSASVEEAEDAYHRLLRREHPDLHHGSGPERVARAEQRTRALNNAISAIRQGRAVRVDVGATASDHTGAATDEGPTNATGPTPEDGPWDRDGSWDDDQHEWRPPREPTERPMATCPWCGRAFVRAVDLKDHVFDDHDLRLDRKQRPSWLGGRLNRAIRKAGHLPLWAVVPINALVATVVALMVTGATDELLGWWTGGITMAPTAVVLIDRLSDIEL